MITEITPNTDSIATNNASNKSSKSKKIKQKGKKVMQSSNGVKTETTTTTNVKGNGNVKKENDKSEFDKSGDAIRKMEAQMGSKAPARNKGDTPEEEAEKLKKEGNDHYVKGRYTLAIESYTKAIKLTPSNPKLFANRALVRLRCNEFSIHLFCFVLLFDSKTL